MTANQEEALYDFLDNADEPFDLEEIVTYIKSVEPRRINKLAAETEAFINLRRLAFPSGIRHWVSRRGCFEKLSFVISPSRLELVNGILVPGHRCMPFANYGLLPQEYVFYWKGRQIPFTTTEGSPEDFYPFYSIFGEEYVPQYIARDNPENEEAFNIDPYNDPPEVSIKTLDMRNIYRETSFVPGDRFTVKTIDWKAGAFDLEKVSKDEWKESELLEWFEAAETGFESSFNNLGPGSCTEEQIAFAYWFGGERMRSLPAYSLEYFLFEKTEKVEIAAYGIETRFWHAGCEIPDIKELDIHDTRPDKTSIEEIFSQLKIPVSEFVIQSYIRDSLFREEQNAELITERLIPLSAEINNRDRKFLCDYIESVQEEFREFYTAFSDKAMGPVRSRAAELHTAVVDLALKLNKSGADLSWLPRHTYIILSQIQNHMAAVLEDLDCDDAPPEPELEALDNSLDSMIETYEDIKELIDESMESYRRNKLAVIRAGNNSGAVMERLVQLSISGIDVWRRVIVSEDLKLKELHQIIQTVFGWRNSHAYKFNTEKIPEVKPIKQLYPVIIPLHSRSSKTPGKNDLLEESKFKDLDARNIIEMFYEYGTKWTVRIIILSRFESPVKRPVRCLAGAGAAPPEFVGGPLRFKRILHALESGNDTDRINARQELGPEFNPGEFNLDLCNRNLYSIFFGKTE